jgi:hypothetical protein
MKQTAAQITGYSSNTSDHYPVLARYNFYREQPTPPTGLSTLSKVTLNAYPNPATDFIWIDPTIEVGDSYVIGMDGRKFSIRPEQGNRFDVSAIPNGLYRLVIEDKQSLVVVKCLIQHP